MDTWGRYDSDSSSSSEDDVYFDDIRKTQQKKCETTVLYKPNSTKNKRKSETTHSSSNCITTEPDNSFSSTSSESPTYEIDKQFSGSDSSFEDSNSPYDLSTPRGWKNKDKLGHDRNQYASFVQSVTQRQHQEIYQNCDSLKWPTQQTIITCNSNSHGVRKSNVQTENGINGQMIQNRIAQESTSSFSSVKGEIGESPDFASLDTPSSCDDNSPIYQNTMKGKRLFDVRQKSRFSDMSVNQDKYPFSSYPSLTSLDAFGFEGNEELCSYSSLPYISYLDESVARFHKKSSSHLPSSSSIMSNFNETMAPEREEMANISNFSSASGLSSAFNLKKPVSNLKNTVNSDLSPVSLISNFTESVGEAREGLASYNSLTSLYKSPSESNYKQMVHQLPSASKLLSADYIDMNSRCGEALASYTSLPSFQSDPSSEEASFNLNSTIISTQQSDYVEMKSPNENLCSSNIAISDVYSNVDQNRSCKCPASVQSQISLNSANTSKLAKQFFTTEDLSGDYVELSKCQAYLAAVRKREIQNLSSECDTLMESNISSSHKEQSVNSDSRTISPSPIVSLKHSDNEIDKINSVLGMSYCDKSSASLISFQGNTSTTMALPNNLTISESLCEHREALASCTSLPDFDYESQTSSLEPFQNLNDVSKISSNGVAHVCSSQNIKPDAIETITEETDNKSLASSSSGMNIIPFNCEIKNVIHRKGTFSDSGVECGSVSSPLVSNDYILKSETLTSKFDNQEVFSSCCSSSLNSTSSVADSGSQCLSQTSESSETSTASNSGKSNTTILIVDFSICDKAEKNGDILTNCEFSESANTTSSVNDSTSNLSDHRGMSNSTSMSSVYSTCSDASSVPSLSTEVTHLKRPTSNSNNNLSNLTNVQCNKLNCSKHSIYSETENASLLSLYGNGASTPRASASSAVAFPSSHILVSPITTYSTIPGRSVGGSRVVTSPCVKPSMLNLKEPNSDGAFLNYKTNTDNYSLSCKSKRALDNSANVNTKNSKSLKDKEIIMDSLMKNGGRRISSVDGTDSRIHQIEEEEEIQMVYASAFRRIDVGASNIPSNVVVRSTVKRVPSIYEPKHSMQNSIIRNIQQKQQTNSNSLGSLNSPNSNAQFVQMRPQSATIRSTRPQSASGRIQGRSSTLPRTGNCRSQYSVSRVVRLQTGTGRMESQLSPQRRMLPDIIPFASNEQEDVLLPAPEVFFQAPLPYGQTAPQQPTSLPSAQISAASHSASNYMSMSGSNAHFPSHKMSHNMDSVSISSLFQHGSEDNSADHYAMDSSNSSLDCDNFSFDFNQPEDSVTSVMFSSTVDFQQSEDSAETQIYQDIDAHGFGHGATGGQDFESKSRRHREKVTLYEQGRKSPNLKRRLITEDKENSPDKRNYPKSPLPVNRTVREKKPEVTSPKKTSRFFAWPHKGDSSPKSKLFSLKKKEKKESSKSKRKKEAYERYEPVPIFDHDTDWKTKLHTLCNGRRVVRYLNYSESPMIIKHYPPPKESTKIKWNSNLVQLNEESDDSNDYAVIHPKSILSKKSKDYKFDGDVPSPIIITKTRQLSVTGRRSLHK